MPTPARRRSRRSFSVREGQRRDETVLFVAVMTPLGMLAVRGAIRRARARGTILEY
jgi:hypothetical protein